MCSRSTSRDPDRPPVCLDETSKQLIAETRVPIPMKPGRVAGVDYEYERDGITTCSCCSRRSKARAASRDGPPHRFEGFGRHSLPARQDHRAHPGQSQHSRHYTRLSRLPKRGGWLSASNGTTRPSTAVGLISQNPNSAFCPPNASTAASQTNRPSSTKSPPGSKSAMPITTSQTGTSPPKMLALNSSTYTLQFD